MNKTYEKHYSSILGLEANLVSLLVYLVPFLISLFSYGSFLGNFSWIIPLLALIFEKESKLVKFHAWQALLMTLFYGALGILITVVGFTVSLTSLIAGNAGGAVGGAGVILLVGIISVIISILEIIAAIKAFGWVSFRLPIIGKWSSRLSNEDE